MLSLLIAVEKWRLVQLMGSSVRWSARVNGKSTPLQGARRLLSVDHDGVDVERQAGHGVAARRHGRAL